ncbi:hypothetical protein CCR94_10180 [Rhodoblastus sphagnicola]|uniref:Uncharacterized protein n=1 Tax=Rhodoblastus sphagnicola TaxID=333368 RepID=A0A2S6N8Z4_9HYPH|nr:hypothetical protein CCR94_10180 [Rhodoblastus sphagnicola]
MRGESFAMTMPPNVLPGHQPIANPPRGAPRLLDARRAARKSPKLARAEQVELANAIQGSNAPGDGLANPRQERVKS